MPMTLNSEVSISAVYLDVVREVRAPFAVKCNETVIVMLKMRTDLIDHYTLMITGTHLREIIADMERELSEAPAEALSQESHPQDVQAAINMPPANDRASEPDTESNPTTS